MAPTNPLTYADRGSSPGDPATGYRRSGVGRAHGKAILLGEHAVVYGAPALAIPVPRLTATATATRFACPGDGADEISFAMAGPGSTSVTELATDGLRHLVAEFKERAGVVARICVDVLIDCAIPQGRGLGSSAACARAAVLALADLFDHRLDAGAVFDLVQASETVAHGRASGIDALTTGATAPLLFRAGTARELPVAMSPDAVFPDADAVSSDADAGSPGPVGEGGGAGGFDALFVIADSGVGGSTREAVELLRRRFERSPETRETFVRRVSSLTHAALRDLADGRLGDFGARLTENHRLLREVGISTDRIDALVDAALAAGSPGAKITGGGLGGCVIALAEDPARAAEVERRVHQAGAVRSWVVPTGRFASHAG